MASFSWGTGSDAASAASSITMARPNYTYTTQGLGTITFVTFTSLRIGDMLSTWFTFYTGVGTASYAGIVLPAGLTIDKAKAVDGVVVGKLNAINTPFSNCLTLGSSANNIVFFGPDTSNYAGGTLGNSWASNTCVGGYFSVPITGWTFNN